VDGTKVGVAAWVLATVPHVPRDLYVLMGAAVAASVPAVTLRFIRWGLGGIFFCQQCRPGASHLSCLRHRRR
jgi:hypothetical protein